MVPFNIPYFSGNELEYINQAVNQFKHVSGNGTFTKKCQSFFEDRFHFKKCLLTTSCTDALEMAALLLDIKKDDEIIIPSYTFVSSALPFVRQGAKIVFADSRNDHPGIDELSIEKLITSKTKAIVVVHYGGVACDMDIIMDIANKHNLFVIEDAAQAIDSYYKGKPLGGIGHFGCFSFHETKNIQCGEGGMLAINDERFIKRSEVIWEKGTNRAEFFRGEVNKYGWVDIGSSFLMSDILAAFLFAQLESLELIQQKRKSIWEWYDKNIDNLLVGFKYTKPVIPDFASKNSHVYYLILESLEERTRLIQFLKEKEVASVFHYICLHSSKYNEKLYGKSSLKNAEKFENCLLRLPLYPNLNVEEVNFQKKTTLKK